MSPGGLSYIGRSKEILGEIPGAVAIKRMDLDEALAKEAQRYCSTLLPPPHPFQIDICFSGVKIPLLILLCTLCLYAEWVLT